MTTRRKLIFGTAVLLAAGGWAGVASAASDELLADLLYGVTDALTREYIREHYREGRWDGHRWYYDGRWYSREAYRRFLAERAAAFHRPPPPPPPRPAPPPPQAHRPPHRPEPPGHRPGGPGGAAGPGGPGGHRPGGPGGPGGPGFGPR